MAEITPGFKNLTLNDTAEENNDPDDKKMTTRSVDLMLCELRTTTSDFYGPPNITISRELSHQLPLQQDMTLSKIRELSPQSKCIKWLQSLEPNLSLNGQQLFQTPSSSIYLQRRLPTVAAHQYLTGQILTPSMAPQNPIIYTPYSQCPIQNKYLQTQKERLLQQQQKQLFLSKPSKKNIEIWGYELD